MAPPPGSDNPFEAASSPADDRLDFGDHDQAIESDTPDAAQLSAPNGINFHFLVLTPEYGQEHVTVHATPPLSVAETVVRVNQARGPPNRHRFPRLIPPEVQPALGVACLIAVPNWPFEGVPALFVCTGHPFSGFCGGCPGNTSDGRYLPACRRAGLGCTGVCAGCALGHAPSRPHSRQARRCLHCCSAWTAKSSALTVDTHAWHCRWLAHGPRLSPPDRGPPLVAHRTHQWPFLASPYARADTPRGVGRIPACRLDWPHCATGQAACERSCEEGGSESPGLS